MQHETVGRESAAVDKRRADRLFHRDLPGGGYVAIEVADRQADARRVRVIVERRADRSRRLGHWPPIILEADWKSDSDFGELYRIANDNVAIARGLLRLPRAD